MVEMITESMEVCLKDFDDLNNQDQYISKKKYDEFVDRYQDYFQNFSKYAESESEIYQRMKELSQNGYQMIDGHNEKFVQRKLEEYKDYFDHMFDEVDSNIKLDEEQRKAILIDEDYSLVIAGAGSGKTTTIAAKVKFLVEKRKVDPKQIILLAFTNKAADELDERINEDFKLGVSVLTFHKLGADFIRKIKKEKVSIIGNAGQYQLLASYVKNIVFPDKQLLKSLMEAFPKEIHFDEKCLEYENFEDYWNYYTELKYEECKNDLAKEVVKRTRSRMKYNKTINGEYVKSEGEVKIANYLYKNNINYSYEELYPEKLNYNRTYKPDFTVHDGGDSIYIEYYGLAKLGKGNQINCYDNDYRIGIFRKRAVHNEYQTDLIELFGQYEEKTSYLPELSKALDEKYVHKHKRTDKELFYRLMETSEDSLFFNFLHLVMKFITLFKEQNYQKEDLERMIKEIEDEKLRKQLQVMRAFYLQYELDIREKNQIDFSDMINFAYHKMETLKEQYKDLNYQYVIIDEYQDISEQRYHFAKRLSDLFNAKIVAVGDDWQAIFSFSGSDVELFTKFYESMGYAEIVKITKTYRNSQELIDLAGEFVGQNIEQFQKELSSDKHLEKPVELIEYDEDLENEVNNLPEQLRKALLKIYEENPEHQVLLLGRYKKDIDNILNSKYFKKGSYDSIILKEKPDMKLEFLTVHSAKGLGYDQVVLLNVLDDTYGFPSKIEDHNIIKFIRNKEEKSFVDYPEERRLFYVALTRTKNKVYIMCPKQINYQSDFIREIIWHDSVKIG